MKKRGGKRELIDLRDTAYHEVGHAVYLEYMGWPVVSVTVEADDRALGRVTTVPFDATDFPGEYDDGRDEFLENALCANLAGAVAVELAGGRSAVDSFDDEESGTFGDFSADHPLSVSNICRSLNLGEWNEDQTELDITGPVRDYAERAAEVLRGRWEVVEGIVELVLIHGTLSGRDVRWEMGISRQ